MARRSAARALCLIIALAAGVARADAPDASDAVDELATTIGPRPQGSPAAARAVDWIERELRSYGADVERLEVGTVELPAIRVMGTDVRHAHPITVRDPDLIVRFGTGDGKALLVMAHYDSVPTSPGATDNAAAVAVLLDLARELAHAPPPQPVMLAFTAAEENGLVGAEALAAEYADRVSFAIALDLVGGDGQLVVNGAGTLIGRSELAWLADAADRADVDLAVPAVHRVVSRTWPQSERSDHGPFTRRGTRAIHFYNRGNDGDWIDLAYHSASDVPSRVHRERLAELGRLVRVLVASPPPAHDGDGFWIPGGIVVPRAWLVGAELVLALVALVTLIRSRAGLLAIVTRSRAKPSGAGLLAGIACYVGAVAVAWLVERVAASDRIAPWLHAPGRAELAAVMLIGGVLGLASRAVARIAPWRGESRYLATAIGVLLATGLAWLALGAAELAWVWLVPAALLAIAVHARPLAPIAIASTALPIVLALYPARLREAAWNGFLPYDVPITALVGVLGIPVAAAVAWGLRRHAVARRGPLGPLVLGLGALGLVLAGLVATVTTPRPCTRAEFVNFGLACERVSGLH